MFIMCQKLTSTPSEIIQLLNDLHKKINSEINSILLAFNIISSRMHELFNLIAFDTKAGDKRK